MSGPTVLVETQEWVRTLTFNRPEARNAFNSQQYRELFEFQRIDIDQPRLEADGSAIDLQDQIGGVAERFSNRAQALA